MTFAVPEETIDQAIRMRAARMSWGRISRTLGYSIEVLRWRMDEDWAEKQRERTRKRFPPMAQQNRSSKPWGIPQEEIAAVLRTVPADTRTFTARALGDPLPGRSALDRRNALDTAEGQTARLATEFSTGGCGDKSLELLVRGTRSLSMEDRHSNEEAVQ